MKYIVICFFLLGSVASAFVEKWIFYKLFLLLLMYGAVFYEFLATLALAVKKNEKVKFSNVISFIMKMLFYTITISLLYNIKNISDLFPVDYKAIFYVLSFSSVVFYLYVVTGDIDVATNKAYQAGIVSERANNFIHKLCSKIFSTTESKMFNGNDKQ